MSADKLVFDLSQEIEGQPQIFIKKDWLNILDNMNQNYSANQTIIDTSQLSNSNKWMNYREAYLSVPLLMCLTGNGYTAPALGNLGVPTGFQPATVFGGATAPYIMGTSADYVMGLRNWFGTIIHSFTLDMNGTTIIQQTPFINMVNSFRLLTSLSWGDVLSQGSVIGFYPDTPTSFSLNGALNVATTTTGTSEGQGVCNNTLYPSSSPYIPQFADSAQFAQYDKNAGNVGLVKRIQMINLDPDGIVGSVGPITGTTLGNFPIYTTSLAYRNLMTNGGTTGQSQSFQQLWLSHINSKVNGAAGTLNSSQLVISVCATIYLKHLHNFFAMIPLLKGTFFKMTAFLNNATTTFSVANKVVANDASALPTNASRPGLLSVQAVNCAVGGTNPLMITGAGLYNGGSDGLGNGVYTASIQVGAQCLSTTQSSAGVATGVLSRSIYLYVPAYTFNAPFERAYLSSPVKSVKYSDYYQYQVLGVNAGTNFNNLLTNGIANMKSILIIPYYSTSATGGAVGSAGAGSGLPSGVPVFESPFDTAGSGTTSPMCLFSNFNVVISGQNTIYNTQMRAMEQFNNQLKGCNAVNGDMTDGLTSGLLSSLGFQSSQCFWYVNVSRQLPVEEGVTKSVQIQGQNLSNFALDLYCFIEYGVAVDIDSLTGARV